MVENDELHSSHSAAERLHVSHGTLAFWRCSGRGPCYVKIGRAVFYAESAIVAWLRAQERDPSEKKRASQ
jgi:hypothetical protein